MADSTMYVPSTMDSNGWGGTGNGFVWAFLIFALLGFGGNGFGGRNGYQPQYATQQDVQTTSMFGQMLDGNRDITNQITSSTAQTVSALKDSQLSLQNGLSSIASLGQSIQAKQSECCASIQQSLAQEKYENAQNTASINANTTAQVQKVLDAIQRNKIESLQQQVNSLQQQLASVGTVKYPMSMAYSAGTSPFCGAGCFG